MKTINKLLAEIDKLKPHNKKFAHKDIADAIQRCLSYYKELEKHEKD